MKILSSAAPTFACPGNHDGGIWARQRGGYPNIDEIKSILSEGKVVLLENESAEITIRNHKIIIGGLGDIWAGRCVPDDIQEAFDSTKSELRIILTHNPDSKIKTKNLKWDIILAGHTHRGQFSLPILGTPFAPVNDKKYVNGLYEYMGGSLYVSPGIGNLHGLRINCRPEISILEIRN